MALQTLPVSRKLAGDFPEELFVSRYLKRGRQPPSHATCDRYQALTAVWVPAPSIRECSDYFQVAPKATKGGRKSTYKSLVSTFISPRHISAQIWRGGNRRERFGALTRSDDAAHLEGSKMSTRSWEVFFDGC